MGIALITDREGRKRRGGRRDPAGCSAEKRLPQHLDDECQELSVSRSDFRGLLLRI